MSSRPAIYLKSQEERRIRGGHRWVFSNEIDAARSPFSQLPSGQLIDLFSSSQHFLGVGYLNPASLITIRLISVAKGQSIGDWLIGQLRTALALRERLFAQPCYRLVFGESDGLPGVVVDRFGDYLVVQVNTAGMDLLQEQLLDALEEVLHPKGILLRNDTGSRGLEGLPSVVAVGRGEVPEETVIDEDGVRFLVPLQGGQKTGWFYDQRWHRRGLKDYAAGARVLDLFSYIGGWGVSAAAYGASEALCVDSSAPALAYVGRNAELNGVGDRVRTRQGDAFDVLRLLREEKETFDVIVVDPPAFIKRKKDLRNGLDAYRRVNEMAMQLAAPDAIFISCSCSWHLPRTELEQVCWRAARQGGFRLQLLQSGGQGPDHPVHPAMPETQYLKTIVTRLHRP